MSKPLQLKVAGKSDVGLVRTSNEDCLHLDEDNGIFVVCDGMGGHQAGEVASMMAADVIDIAHRRFPQEILSDVQLQFEPSVPPSGNLLLRSIRLANRAIYNKAVLQPTLAGMGTTVVALAFEGDMLSVAHVGDSRAYRVAQRALEPLTVDHSWVAEVQQNQMLTEEEASQMVGKNVITRALGVRDTVEVDYRMVTVRPGDMFMICSDGLCGFADDDEIFSVIHKARNDIERVVNDLVQMANDRGGADNVTVAVVEVIEAAPSDASSIEAFTLPDEPPAIQTAEDLWVEKIGSFSERSDQERMDDPGEGGASKRGLLILFALFVIVAAFILYFATR